MKADLGDDVLADEKEIRTMKSGIFGLDEFQKSNHTQIRRQLELLVRH